MTRQSDPSKAFAYAVLTTMVLVAVSMLALLRWAS